TNAAAFGPRATSCYTKNAPKRVRATEDSVGSWSAFSSPQQEHATAGTRGVEFDRRRCASGIKLQRRIVPGVTASQVGHLRRIVVRRVKDENAIQVHCDRAFLRSTAATEKRRAIAALSPRRNVLAHQRTVDAREDLDPWNIASDHIDELPLIVLPHR